MTAIDMPSTPGFVSSRFGLEANTLVFTNDLNKAVQRVRRGGARWVATLSLPAMKREQAAPWKVFFLQLDGRANTFNAYDPDCKVPRGIATGTPLVAGASQSGISLNIDGCTANIVGWLLPGDYFAVNGELKMITASVSTNGSGQATLNFKPALRYSPADNAPLTLTKATCTMALADDMQAIWECDVRGIYMPKTFTAMEVFS